MSELALTPEEARSRAKHNARRQARLANRQIKRPVPRAHPEFTQERLRHHFDYDPATGIFIRRTTQRPTGTAGPGGYIHIGIGHDRVYKAHRIAFMWMTGSCPPIIDHVDGNPSNNAWANLREATRSQNNSNRKKARGCYKIRGGKWRASITINYVSMNLGHFDTEEEARAAYVAKAREQRGEFAGV